LGVGWSSAQVMLEGHAEEVLELLKK